MSEPIEVDFAARYWAGDWTEGDVGRRREAWVCGEDDDPIFVWRSDDGPFMVFSFDATGQARSLALLDHDEERVIMTTHDRQTGEENTWVMELTDEGVIMEISVPPEELP